MFSRIRRTTTLIALLALLCLWAEGAAALTETVHSFHIRLFTPGTRTVAGASGTERIEFRFESNLEVVIPYDGGSIADEYGPWAEFIDPRVVIDGVEIPLDLDGRRFDVIFRPDGSVAWAEPVPQLAAYGIDLTDILATLYPPPPPPETTRWTAEYPHRLFAPGGVWQGSMVRRYDAMSPTEIQMIVSHQTTSSAVDGRPGVIWIGSASLRLDPTSRAVNYVSYSLRANFTSPDGSESVEYRLILLIERVGEDVRVRESDPREISVRYDDPAQRFRLELPVGWDPEGRRFHGTSTVLTGPDGSLLIVDIFSADPQLEPEAVLAQLVALYGERLPEFQLLTLGESITLAGEKAWLAEYQYVHEGVLLIEGSVLAPFADQYFLLTLVDPAERYRETGRETLERIAERLAFVDPHGHVDAELLRSADWVRYQSREWHVELEVPEYWVPVDGGPQAGIRFAEIGGAGHLQLHFEPAYTNPGDLDPLVVLRRWLEQAQQADPALGLIEPPSPTLLGGAAAATVTVGTTDGAGVAWQRQLIISVWGEDLVALSLDYRSEGFAERLDIFERIVRSVRPWTPSAAVVPGEPRLDPPADDSGLLVIGQVLHVVVSDLSFSPLPASSVEVSLQIGSAVHSVFTDDQGYFYLANIPPGEPIALQSVQGRLFDREEVTVLTFEDFEAQVRGRVALLGELLLALTPRGEVRALMQYGIDSTTRHSRLHAYVMGRFAESPWSDVLQANLPLWFEPASAGNS